MGSRPKAAKRSSEKPGSQSPEKHTKAEKAKNGNHAASEAVLPVKASGSSSLLFLSSYTWKASVVLSLISIAIGLGLLYWSNQLNTSNQTQPTQGKADRKTDPTASSLKPPTQMTISEIKKRAKTLPCKDRRDANECATMAHRGDCEHAPGWMAVMCAASCGRCDLLDPKKRCSEENMRIKLVNAFKPGDLNKMFETLPSRAPHEVEIINTKPWMILVKNFITELESSTLLNLTMKGLKRSTDQGAMGEDGFQEQVVTQYRTSSNSWCMFECESHPVVEGLMQRISDLVLAPVANFESFQVLQYELGQKYDTHHDASAHEFTMPAGPRVLTFFMYLSDVEEGGETHFPKLNISVRPQKGSALLWPSVDNDHPDSHLEPLTYHAALPVKKGLKYAANSWIHMRNYKIPNVWGCTGAFD